MNPKTLQVTSTPPNNPATKQVVPYADVLLQKFCEILQVVLCSRCGTACPLAGTCLAAAPVL